MAAFDAAVADEEARMECSEMGNPFEQYTDTAEEEESPFAGNGEINVTSNDNVEFTEDDDDILSF